MVYMHDWAESGEQGMLDDFNIQPSEIEGAEILVASYTYEDYSGSAYVLFRRDGKLFEVHGGHCSCYGLSESDYSGSTGSQWQPEEIDIDALRHRLNTGYWDVGDVKEAVTAAIN